MGKKDIINDIEKVVQNGNFDDGKILVNEYKKNFGNDSKIASVEAAINFYEGKLNKALEVVKEGLRFNLLESDLYSIMGSIYESKCEYNRAYLCYEQALYLCADDEKKDYIMKNIYKLNSNCDIQINNVSFIILTSDNLENIKNCINSIRSNVIGENYEIIVVDNNSSDETIHWLNEQNDVKCIFNDRNEGFLKRFNQGIELSNKDNDIFLLNNDVMLMINSVFNMRMALYSNDNIGAIGAVSNDSLNIKESVEFAKNNNVTNNSYKEIELLNCNCILIKREALNKIKWQDDKINILNYKMFLCKDAYVHILKNKISNEEKEYINENFNKKLSVDELLELTDNVIEKSYKIMNLAKNKKYLEFEKKVSKLLSLVYKLDENFEKDKFKKEIADCTAMSKSIISSLRYILIYEKTRSNKLLSKIEFELIPLLQELKVYLFYYGKACKSEKAKNKYFNELMPKMCSNKYIDKYEKLGQYKYDLSIIVVGYNKLEYTKMCIDSLIENMPTNINYELILINHGSSDGTKEYFESLAPTKQLDILINGGGSYAISRIIEGKLFIMISNDVIIGENAINNMLKCIDSDKKIAYIVPSTPNISNCQNIDNAQYSNMEELKEFTKKNNVSNSCKWEERVRLCNPVTMGRSYLFYGSKGIFYNRYYSANDSIAFPDDKISLLLRRKGYKMILAKDAYCYHFGSVTIKDDIKEISENENVNLYDIGRKEFYDFFKVDPWGKGCCYDKEFVDNIRQRLIEKDKINILGINCGLGSNPLKVKEIYKENGFKRKINLTNITSEKNTFLDLNGISDYAYEISDKSIVCNEIKNNKYDYIVVEKNKIYNLNQFCNALKNYKSIS